MRWRKASGECTKSSGEVFIFMFLSKCTFMAKKYTLVFESSKQHWLRLRGKD